MYVLLQASSVHQDDLEEFGHDFGGLLLKSHPVYRSATVQFKNEEESFKAISDGIQGFSSFPGTDEDSRQRQSADELKRCTLLFETMSVLSVKSLLPFQLSSTYQHVLAV